MNFFGIIQTSITIALISRSLTLTLSLSQTDIWQVFYKHWTVWIVPITPFLLQEDEVQANNHSTEAYLHPSRCIMQINLVKYFGLINADMTILWIEYYVASRKRAGMLKLLTHFHLSDFRKLPPSEWNLNLPVRVDICNVTFFLQTTTGFDNGIYEYNSIHKVW